MSCISSGSRQRALFLRRFRASTTWLHWASIDDITGEAEQVHVPTTNDEHPNWQQRRSRSLEELTIHPWLDATCKAFCARGAIVANQQEKPRG